MHRFNITYIFICYTESNKTQLHIYCFASISGREMERGVYIVSAWYLNVVKWVEENSPCLADDMLLLFFSSPFCGISNFGLYGVLRIFLISAFICAKDKKVDPTPL